MIASKPSQADGKPPRPASLSRGFTSIADRVARVTGHPYTFLLSCIVITLWAVAGLYFHGLDRWQSVVNTVMAIVTFLVVFLIQSTQNRDSAAIQAKLDELIRALEPAKNKFMGIEKLTIEEVRELSEECVEEVKLLEEKVGEALDDFVQLDLAQERLAPQDA